MNDLPVGILLAAGQSTRFGSHKLLYPLPDSNIPIALQAAQTLIKVLPHSVAVVRKDDHALKTLLSYTGIEVVENPQPNSGISSSIRCGINALQPNSTGWVIALADMPYIPDTIIWQVANAVRQGELICAPLYNNQRGHPVGFSVKMTEKLLDLQGDQGANQLINEHGRQLKVLNVNDKSVLQDVDQLSDLIF